jgi:hypothetical protein
MEVFNEIHGKYQLRMGKKKRMMERERKWQQYVSHCNSLIRSVERKLGVSCVAENLLSINFNGRKANSEVAIRIDQQAHVGFGQMEVLRRKVLSKPGRIHTLGQNHHATLRKKANHNLSGSLVVFGSQRSQQWVVNKIQVSIGKWGECLNNYAVLVRVHVLAQELLLEEDMAFDLAIGKLYILQDLVKK